VFVVNIASVHMLALALVGHSVQARDDFAIGQSIKTQGISCMTSLCHGVLPDSHFLSEGKQGLVVPGPRGILQTACGLQVRPGAQLVIWAATVAKGSASIDVAFILRKK